MPVYRLTDLPVFPPPQLAEPGGLVAVGGDLSPQRLLVAYRSGIFPWYSEGEPIWWHSPDPRFVLDPKGLHVPRSLAKVIRRADYEIRFDTSFREVILGCARTRRPGQRGTWVTRAMIRAYLSLHDLGLAHSAEAYSEGVLMGGLYGVCLGDIFFGESMFSQAPDASKVAFVVLTRWMQERGVELIDSQVHTDHLARFGAGHIPREEYLLRLAGLVDRPTRRGRWELEADDPALKV